MKCMLSFLAGGLVGATVALLMAPMKGEDLRAKIKTKGEDLRAKIMEALRRRGLADCDEVDELVDQIAAEIEAQS